MVEGWPVDFTIISKKKFVFPGLEDSLSVIPNAIQIIEYQLKMKMLFQISLSRKAGVAIFGFEKVNIGKKEKLVNNIFNSVSSKYNLMNDLSSLN